MFDKAGIYYFKNPLDVVFDHNWILDPVKISDLKQYPLVVADFSSEHYGPSGVDHVYHALEHSGVNFLLLTHDPQDHLKFPRMFFYNHWYHWSRDNFKEATVEHTNRQWAWSCLNGNPRPHRIYNFLFSQQQEYFSQACFSFFNADNASRNDDVELPTDVQQQWNVLRTTLPNRLILDDSAIRVDAVLDIPALTDSCIHLVSETTVIPKIFISEKTWKPMASKQLFLVFGNPGTVEFLRAQGVDVFDDLINHSYDQQQDWQLRLEQIHQEIKRLVNMGAETIWNQTQQRRQHNYENFWAGKFDRSYTVDINSAIDQYLK